MKKKEWYFCFPTLCYCTEVTPNFLVTGFSFTLPSNPWCIWVRVEANCRRAQLIPPPFLSFHSIFISIFSLPLSLYFSIYFSCSFSHLFYLFLSFYPHLLFLFCFYLVTVVSLSISLSLFLSFSVSFSFFFFCFQFVFVFFNFYFTFFFIKQEEKLMASLISRNVTTFLLGWGRWSWPENFSVPHHIIM